MHVVQLYSPIVEISDLHKKAVELPSFCCLVIRVSKCVTLPCLLKLVNVTTDGEEKPITYFLNYQTLLPLKKIIFSLQFS
jgi:hypothetical protein